MKQKEQAPVTHRFSSIVSLMFMADMGQAPKFDTVIGLSMIIFEINRQWLSMYILYVHFLSTVSVYTIYVHFVVCKYGRPT